MIDRGVGPRVLLSAIGEVGVWLVKGGGSTISIVRCLLNTGRV
jgi:hypothetical protein